MTRQRLHDMTGDATFKASPGRPDDGFFRLLRAAARIAVVAGAAGSFGLMLHVGRHNNSHILLVLFTIWDLSPFIALVLADIVLKRWPVLTRTTLYSVMLIIALGSLAIYADVAFGPPRPQPAFMFLVVPLASWVLMAAAIAIAAFVSGRRTHRG
jgi:hypothetical protein